MPYKIKNSLIQKILKSKISENSNAINSSEQLFRLDNDVNEIVEIYETIFLCISCLGRTVGAIIAGFMISWQLSILLVLTGLINLYLVKTKIEPLYSISKEMNEYEEVYFSRLFEFISNHAFYKNMLNLKKYKEKRNELNDKYNNSSYKAGLLNAKIELLTSGIYSIITILMVFLGVFLISIGSLSIGGLVAFLAIQGMLVDPYHYFGEFVEKISSVLSSYDRVMEIHTLYKQEEDKDNNLLEPIKNKKFEIRIQDLSFKFENEVNLLDKISINVKSGEICYIVGESGCGKTTLFKLLMKHFNPNAGTIKVFENGLEHELSYKDITYVSSNPLCFNASIVENITFSKDGINQERLDMSTKMAGIYDDIIEMPDKYDTKIKDNGKNLSRGQAARISMARAFYRDSKILLLDEVFAALDKPTSDILQRSIEERVKHNGCVFIITHRSDWIPKLAKVVSLRKAY
jgi:ABC-type multidrug transport system fused ATPase/permease subunit